MALFNPFHDRGLWGLIIAPTLWAAHFLSSYAAAALFCEKGWLPGGSLLPVQLTIFGFTAVYLPLIAFLGWRAYHRWGLGEGAQPPHDADTDEDRDRFLGMATMLLCGLSFVATAYTAMAAVFAASCR